MVSSFLPGRFTAHWKQEQHPCLNSGLGIGRVDLAGIGKDAESFQRGGEAERRMEGDEAGPLRALAAPDQGGGQLQGLGGPQRMDGRMDGEQAQGAGSQLLGGLDLEAPLSQMVEHPPGLLEVGRGDRLPALGGEQGLPPVEGCPPPEGHLRIALQEGLDPLGGGLPYGQRQEGRAVPEPQTASRSSQSPGSSGSSRDRRRGATRYSARGSCQNVSSSRFSGALIWPPRTSSWVAAAGDDEDNGMRRAIGRPCSVTRTSSPAFTRARVSESN